MPTFKPKPNKKFKVSKKNITTLDGKHKEFVSEFLHDEAETIPALVKERKEWKEKLAAAVVAGVGVEERLDMEDKIRDLGEAIRAKKNKRKEYYLDNSKYIFDYFENKKNIAGVGGNVDAGGGSASKVGGGVGGQSKNKWIHSFFKIKDTPDASGSDATTLLSHESLSDAHESKNQSNTIVQRYLSNIDDAFLDMTHYMQPTHLCQHCQQGELIPLEDEGLLICNQCSHNTKYLIENEKPSYKEPPKEVCFYAYKRINHFKEIIAQFQGKETTQIPEEVIENIKNQIKKERIEVVHITNQKVKEILKKLGYNKYYEHISFIKDKLGIKPPVMSQELEETLFNLFMELQAPYSKFCPDDRVNFLNYYYTAYKLCELLGETEYLPFFPMLKDREKRMEQDNIWKKICEEFDWEFIPTV